MDIQIMTFCPVQAMAYKFINDKNSFGYKLLSKSENFKKHLDALPNLEMVSIQSEHLDNTKIELIPNLNI